MGRDQRTAFRGSSFAAPASWTLDRGYLGWLLDLDRFGQRGGGVCWGCSCLGPRTGDGSAEAESIKRFEDRRKQELEDAARITRSRREDFRLLGLMIVTIGNIVLAILLFVS